MLDRTRDNVQTTTRRAAALYLGAINLAGETISHPGKWLKGIERRGERVLDRIETNNRSVRRSMNLVARNAGRTTSSIENTASSALGVATTLAGDAKAVSPKGRTSRRRRPRVKVAASSSRTGTGSAGMTAKTRSDAAKKAARTRALHQRQADAKKVAANARRRATRTAKASKSSVERTADRVQARVEKMGDRIEHAFSELAS